MTEDRAPYIWGRWIISTRTVTLYRDSGVQRTYLSENGKEFASEDHPALFQKRSEAVMALIAKWARERFPERARNIRNGCLYPDDTGEEGFFMLLRDVGIDVTPVFKSSGQRFYIVLGLS